MTSFKIKIWSRGFWKLGLQQTSCKEPFYVFFGLYKVSIYFCFLGECCDTVLLWSSRNVLLDAKIHLIFPSTWMESRAMMDFHFWVNCSFNAFSCFPATAQHVTEWAFSGGRWKSPSRVSLWTGKKGLFTLTSAVPPNTVPVRTSTCRLVSPSCVCVSSLC